MKSVSPLALAKDKPEYAALVQADVENVASDPELQALSNHVLDAIAALPANAQPAIDVGVIRALGNQTFKAI